MVRKALNLKSSAAVSPHKAVVVRKPKAKTATQGAKAAAAPAPATAAVGAGKRKRSSPTKIELHRRLMREKKRAKSIMKEQERSVTAHACSKNGIRRLIKAALQKVAEDRRVDETEPLQMFNIAKKAVTMIHEVLEDHAVSRFNQASFLLEYAKKTTCTPGTMQCLDRTRMAEERRPVFELPEAGPRPPAAASPPGEEEATASETESESESDSGEAE